MAVTIDYKKTGKFGLRHYLYSAPWFAMLFIVTYSMNKQNLSNGVVEQAIYNKFIIIFVFSVSLICSFFNFQEIFSILKKRRLYIIYLLYITASTAWSEDARSTLRISAYFWCGTSVCLMAVVAFRNNSKKFYQMCIFYSILMVLGSLILIFLNPGRGINESGRWLGITSHPNVLGIVCILSIWANISYLFIIKPKIIKLINILIILLSGVCLYGSNSATSIIISLLVIGLTLIFRFLGIENIAKNYGKFAGLVYAVLLIISILYLSKPELFRIEAVFGMMGRNVTFTGRTELWQLAMAKIYTSPIFGSGFQEFISVKGIEIKHFHNGYLELLVRGGVIALFLVVTFVFQFIFSKKRIKDPNLIISFSIMMLAILLHNITEGSFGRGVTALWLVFSFIYFYKYDVPSK
jgi:O-antigen ligase